MWKYDLAIHSKKPKCLIKAKIVFANATTVDEFYQKLAEMRVKLEMTIPGSFRAKYSLGIDGLLVIISAKNMSEGHRFIYQMEEFIKSAIVAVK